MAAVCEHRTGMRFQQLYYKLKGSGKIGKFTKAQRPAIIDLREIGEAYEWIVLKCDIFNFNLSYAPLGADTPKMVMPLKETTYLVLGLGFVRQADHPEPGVVGRYGLCYAFVPYAPPNGPKIVAYGPGHFAAAIQTF